MTEKEFYEAMYRADWMTSDVIHADEPPSAYYRNCNIDIFYYYGDDPENNKKKGTLDIIARQTVVDVPLKVVDTKITGLNLKDLVSIGYYPERIVFDFEGGMKISIPVKC